MATANANPTRTSQQAFTLPELVNTVLLRIIRDNFTSQYASKADLLAGFRDAVSAHGGPEIDTTLVADFRAHVPLSDYDSYKPFIDKFNVQPCKEEDVMDMFSPGLPDFLALSSATSGTSPKILPKYDHIARLKIQTSSWFDPHNPHPLAAVVCTGIRDVKLIERAPGEVVHRIPVDWYTDDESRMFLATPGCAVPWAATVIGHFPSCLIIHGLFFLARRNVYRFQLPFATQFVDLIRHIDQHWDVLLSCIRDGKIPDLEGIDHVREYLQVHFHSDPDRAAELLEIGPPFSSEGWFSRVWPNVSGVWIICSGAFATVLPKVRSILGPNVLIRSPGYGSSEATMGAPYDENKLDEFVLLFDEIVEFLDISLDASHKNLCQAWEVKVGRYYEPILTTKDGLWRYRLGDVIHIVGFHPVNNSPIFKYSGRRSLTLHIPCMQITDDQLLRAIQTFNSTDKIQVQEFTTVLDDRTPLPTVGFFIEPAGSLGPNAYLARQQLFDALVTTNIEFKHVLERGQICLPTIRIVRAGTFAEYRQWKGEDANIVSGQIKVPTVLQSPTAQEWILERVVQEL